MSTQQAVALLLFNRQAQFTFEEMQTLTGVPEADLKVALRWLCNPKFKVIEKENA